jgi:hypothetical protein
MDLMCYNCFLGIPNSELGIGLGHASLKPIPNSELGIPEKQL